MYLLGGCDPGENRGGIRREVVEKEMKPEWIGSANYLCRHNSFFVSLAGHKFLCPVPAGALTLDCSKCINKLMTLLSRLAEILLTMFPSYFIERIFAHCIVAMLMSECGPPSSSFALGPSCTLFL